MFDIETLQSNQLTHVEQAELFEEITDEQMAQVVGGSDFSGGIFEPTTGPIPIGSPKIEGPLLPPLIISKLGR